jgi:hypothetical protein
MPDPIDELDRFTTPGLSMDPLPAAEVRRRGTRMRRRNHALAAIGGVAAVAIIATPLALAASHDRTDTTPPPIKPSPTVTWVTEIPADFPLADGMPEGTLVDPQAPSGLLTVCGTDVGSVVSGAGAVDIAGATVEEAGSEGTEIRALALYSGAAAATAATDALRELVSGCATDPNGTGTTLVNEMSHSAVGNDASFVVTQQAQGSDGLLSDLTAMEVVRTGNAVYLASSHTTAGGAQVVTDELNRLSDGSAPVVNAMCVFSADPC